MIRRPPRSTLFPSRRSSDLSRLLAEFVPSEDAPSVARLRAAGSLFVGRTNLPEFAWRGSTDNRLFGESRNSRRSEEHTSELQSHLNLVCRLLLEKKKVYLLD